MKVAEHNKHFHPLSSEGRDQGPRIVSDALREAQDGEKVTTMGEDGADHRVEPIREEEKYVEDTPGKLMDTDGERVSSERDKFSNLSSQPPPIAMAKLQQTRYPITD